MIAATMGSSALGVLFFFLIALIPVVILRRGRTRKMRREAALARLSPAISGTVSSKDGRLRGTYRGHAVEAWASQVDPGPSSGDSSGVFVNVLYLQLGGAAGREAWRCSGWPRLNPFAAAEFTFEFGIGPLLPAFGRIFDVPEHDPRLEKRLRAAGLVEIVESLGRESSPFLPDVRYTPAWLPKIPTQLRDTGMRLPVRASESPHEELGALICQVELRGDPVPSPERFNELLDHAVRIVEINAEANPPEGGMDTPF